MTTSLSDIDLNDPPLNFGKYKGRKESEVASIDPRYFLWAANNVSWFEPNRANLEVARKKCPRRITYVYGDPNEEDDDDDWI